MVEVKWIKISVDMFNDEKIKLIRKLPEGDSILLVWIHLLVLAGKCNATGYIYLAENIPYTDEMLATVIDMPVNIIRLALETFQRLKMIEVDEEHFIYIENWEKHQNIQGLEKIREQNRLRKQKQRARQKALEEGKESCHVTSRDSHATDIEEEGEEDIDIDIDIEEDKDKDVKSTTNALSKENINLILEEWNKLGLQQLRNINSNTKRYSMLKARLNEYSLDELVQAIKNIDKSSFLKGQNKNNWTITFDWLVRPNNFIKVLEGNYEDKSNNQQASKPSQKTKFHNFKQRSDKYSEDQLEAIARKKREEYYEKSKKGE